jgi:hypothetical protein
MWYYVSFILASVLSFVLGFITMFMFAATAEAREKATSVGSIQMQVHNANREAALKILKDTRDELERLRDAPIKQRTGTITPRETASTTAPQPSE